MNFSKYLKHWPFIVLVVITIFTIFRFPLKGNRAAASEIPTDTPGLKPNEWLFRQRAYPSGTIDYKAYQTALKYRSQQMAGSLGNIEKNENPWQFCGPTNIGGRITDLALTDTSPQILYAGAASGGIFKSEDKGITWEAIFDGALNLSIGDLALAPSNEEVIYVGTGEANAGGGSLAYDGNGIYKSVNGGDTWAHLGLQEIGSVGKVLVHPNDPNTCFVGAMGRLFENNAERGIFKTSDGGNNWENILFVNDSTGIIDMAINANQPDTLYAAAWERVRRVNRRSYGGESSAIYRSYDGGETWQQLTNGLPESSGRIGIAISHSNPAILYALIADETTSYIKGLYKSVNHGDSWFNVSYDGISNVPYMWWFGKIYVDPFNPDLVYVASFYMHKSTDGGNEWSDIFIGAHVDQHAVIINPQDDNEVIVGNDGGVYISADKGEEYEKVYGLPITQFYTCEIDYSNPEQLYGGTQDNGTLRTLTGNTNDWSRIYGGDGFRVLVDPVDNNIVYAEYQYGNLAKSTDGGFEFELVLEGIAPEDRNNWSTPVVMDPNMSSTLYYGSNRLYKSTDGAVSWSPISADLTGNPILFNLIYGTITTISVSPIDGDVIWVGTDDGKVQVTTNGGATWSLVSESLPDRWVTSVAADPLNADKAYVTFSGYRFASDFNHIYATTNLGENWIDISGNLPDIPVNEIIVTPDASLYIATDIGAWYSKDQGNNWETLGVGLPNVVITDICYHEPDNFLLAATFGRGMYKVSLGDPLSVANTGFDNLQMAVYPNPFSEQVNVKFETKKRQYFTFQIYDAKGVMILKEGRHYSKGQHSFIFTADQLPVGLYFFTVESENQLFRNSIKLVKQ